MSHDEYYLTKNIAWCSDYSIQGLYSLVLYLRIVLKLIALQYIALHF